MKIYLELGGIKIAIHSDRKMSASFRMASFITHNFITADLHIRFTWDWEKARHPQTLPVGEDMLQEYYREGDIMFCESKGGKAPVTCTCYLSDFSWMECAINEKPFLEPPETLDRIFQLMPMRAVFLHFKSLFLHSSQVSLSGTGILFSAPSGTGKTTQAKLWQKFMGAEIICNDRTLIRRKEGIWHTYGYPIDGSEPVCSNAVNRLGCIILLKQGVYNRVCRLKYGQAVGLLMEQAVIDCWDAKARADALELLMEVVQDIPVYQLVCTPDQSAVFYLRDELIKEGVIFDGTDSEKLMG